MVDDWKIHHVQVQTISWCNRSCEFCPSQKIERKPKLMSMATYQRLLAELHAVGFQGRFSPYLQGEPLLDRRLPELISMAHESLSRAKLLVQTNGDMLTVGKGVALFQAGLHKLIINCYDDDHGRLERLRSTAVEIVKQLPQVKHVTGSFYDLIRPEPLTHIRQEIIIEDKTHWTKDGQENWAGNVPGIHMVREPMKAWCFRPFHQLYVHYNGEVVLCCCDWKGEVVFGNINTQSLTEIFSGPVATMYREKLRNKNRGMKLCEVCDFRGTYQWPARVALHVTSLVNRLRGTSL